MGRFFTRERFGRPQFVAAMLLLLFLAQCLWLVVHGRQNAEDVEVFRVDEGLRQWRGVGIAGTPYRREMAQLSSTYLPLVSFEQNAGYDPNHSPLWYLIASASLAVWPGKLQPDLTPYWGWLARVPYLVFGVLLGASLWYVARRLYGNAGGYVALVLYCFSPTMLRSSAVWLAEPEVGAAWGTFGAVFTAIAVAHTLYAPREVVLWNWRRILLLGLSIALAIGSQFSLIVVVPLALLLMLYVVPSRKAAAASIWGAACGFACLLLLASYAFHPQIFTAGLRHAEWWPIDLKAFAVPITYRIVGAHLLDSSPALVIALPISLVMLLVWHRTRYFGNLAPLLIGALCLVFAVGTPHYPGFGFELAAVPFLFVFVAGVAADLLETAYRNLVAACVWGLLTAYAVWNVLELARLGRT